MSPAALGVAAGIAAGALWGFTFVAPHMAPDFGAVAISVARFLVYGGLSLALLLAARAPLGPLLRRHGLAAAWMALTSSVAYFLLMTVAVQRIGAPLTALLIGCLPITVPLAGAWADPRLLRRIAPALALIAAGLLLLQAPALRGLDAPPDAIGLFCGLGALASWTVYALHNARYLTRHPELGAGDWASLTGVMTLPALPLLMLLVPLTGEALPALADPQPWLRLALMALVTGVGSAWLAAWLWNQASRRLPVALAGQLIVAETVFALLYAFVAETRWPAGHETAAIMLVLAGLLAGLHRLRLA